MWSISPALWLVYHAPTNHRQTNKWFDVFKLNIPAPLVVSLLRSSVTSAMQQRLRGIQDRLVHGEQL